MEIDFNKKYLKNLSKYLEDDPENSTLTIGHNIINIQIFRYMNDIGFVVPIDEFIIVDKFFKKNKINYRVNPRSHEILATCNKMNILEYLSEKSLLSKDDISNIVHEACDKQNLNIVSYFVEDLYNDHINELLESFADTLPENYIRLFLTELKRRNIEVHTSHELEDKLCERDDPKIFDLFLSHGMKTTNYFFLNTVVEKNAVSIAMYMIKSQPNIDFRSYSFSICINKNFDEMLDLLLDHSKLNLTKINELFLAAKKSTPEVVQILIDHGADFEKHGQTLLNSIVNNAPLKHYLKDLLNNY